MTKAEDKAADAKQGKAIDKSDAAYVQYQKEQAEYEKTHPGEIDEAAYAKYEAAYGKIPENRPVGLLDMPSAVDPSTPAPVVHTVAATEPSALPGNDVARKPKDWPPHIRTPIPETKFTFVKIDPDAKKDGWVVHIGFDNEHDAKRFYSAVMPHVVKEPDAPAVEPLTL